MYAIYDNLEESALGNGAGKLTPSDREIGWLVKLTSFWTKVSVERKKKKKNSSVVIAKLDEIRDETPCRMFASPPPSPTVDENFTLRISFNFTDILS